MNAKTMKVLIIEDDPDSVEIVRLCLKEPDALGMSFELKSAETLGGGLSLLAQESFDAVLLDLNLPDSVGSGTLTQALPACGEAAVLVMTNMGEESLALEAMRLGAQDFMMKSTSDSRLLKRSIWYAIGRKRLERLRAEMRERRRLDQMKDDLLNTVSHELRTPLAVIKAAIENLWEEIAGPLSPKQAETVSMARRHILRLARMINNLLDLSRLESGRAQPRRRRLNLSSFLREQAESVALANKDKPAKLELAVPAALPEVSADPDMIAEVVVNLVDNAFRYAVSRVTVRARPVDDDTAVEIAVEDDGPGIPADKARDLFNKFVQLHRPPGGAGYKGTGLGLAICRQIMALHGKDIVVESKPGRGAAFRFSLPEFSRAPAAGGSDERKEREGLEEAQDIDRR